jgi:tryptophanyl-tRNA synthetase
MGELKRMTQFKEKGEGQDNISAGLFDYPVLMAADILLYGAKYVPVCADQTQHVELARDIAIRMNNKFDSELFTLPESEKEQIAFTAQQQRLRVRDLVHPDKKMSKSDESGKGVIFLGDTPAVAAKKVMSATTDSVGVINYDLAKQPGISNLLEMLAALSG